MKRNILIIQGHPDPTTVHFGHVLSRKYMEAAKHAGHEVKQIMVARLRFPFLRSKRDKEEVPRRKKLDGRTAHIVVTIGMPAFFYRWYFRAHCLKKLERNILGFCGIKTVGESLIGLIEAQNDSARKKWLGKMTAIGAKEK